MKKILLVTIMLVGSFVMNAQVLKYEQVKNAQKRSEINKEEITEYISENGTSFKIGDVLKIDKPSNGQIFTSMTIRMTTFEMLALTPQEQNNFDYNVYARTIAKTSLKIKSFVIEGDKKKGFSIAANLDGVGHNIQVRLEYGLEIGEIGEHKMTSEEAMVQLKSEKDKMELGLITSEEYNSRKAELVKFIK
ncbi:hypothetical protein AAIP55_002357 [Flavobacterium psychrophilum]|nr:hypothetical protein [Flavobacterium psychrophilum]EKT4518079.1 hypothetical protein [Flavobacterium psychrophilum]